MGADEYHGNITDSAYGTPPLPASAAANALIKYNVTRYVLTIPIDLKCVRTLFI